MVFGLIFLTWNAYYHTGQHMLCADGHIWHHYPVIQGLTSRYFEMIHLLGINQSCCPMAEDPKTLGGQQN
jgi:hypothetical protein